MHKRILTSAVLAISTGCLQRSDTIELKDFLFTLSATPDYVPADGSTTATVTLSASRDGEPFSGQHIEFFTTDHNVVFAQPAPSDNAGTSRGSVHSDVAGTMVLGASLFHGNLIAVLPATATVTFDPLPDFVGVPDLAHNAFNADPNSGIAADGVAASILSVTVRDRYGAPVAHQAVTISSTGSNNVLTPQSGFTDSAGRFTASLTTTTAETKTVTASVGPYISVTYVTFTTGTASILQTTVTANPANSLVADGSSSTQLTVMVKDSIGNPVPNQVVSFSSTGSNNTFTRLNSATDAAGAATTQLTSTKAEPKLVTTDFGTFTKTATVTFIAGPPAAAASAITATPNAQVTADGVKTSLLTVTVNDVHSNAVTGQAVTFTSSGSSNTLNPNTCITTSAGTCTSNLYSIKAEAKTAQANFNGISVTATANFVGGTATQSNTTFVISPTSVVADNSSHASLTLTMRDAFGNLATDQNVTLATSGTGDTFTPISGGSSGGVFSSHLASTKAQAKIITAAFGGG